MKKKIFVAAFCCIATTLFTNSLQAQVYTTNTLPLGTISGKLYWDTMKCNPPVVPFYKKNPRGALTTLNRAYNFTIAVYEKTYPATQILIPGAKVIFGETTKTSQAFTITDIPYSAVTLVFSSGYSSLYTYFTNLCPTHASILVNRSNYRNADLELQCFMHDDANGKTVTSHY